MGILPHSRLRAAAQERQPGRSFEDEDSSLSLELHQRSDPHYLVKAAKRLDVVWSVSSRKVKLLRSHRRALDWWCFFHLQSCFSSQLQRLPHVQEHRPEQCACCGGSGQGRCTFCRGSGALTLGDHVFCSLEEGCKSCPVCKSKGSVKCVHCKGTGARAPWMEEPVCSTD